jgi:hypothetical protein
MRSTKRHSCIRSLKRKGFKEETVIKIGWHDLATSTTLESNKSLKNYTYYLADGVEACAALIIAVAAGQAVYRGMRLFFVRPPEPEARKTDVRLQLG